MQFLELGFLKSSLRSLCAILCGLIYSCIAWLYDLFMTIASVNFLATEEIQPIYERITMVLSIIMVFYVTFEFVKFVVQPDDITSKEKGAGNIVFKMVAVVVLIAFVPKIFSGAYKVQNKIIEQQLFSKIILGKVDINSSSFGQNFSANMLNMFYYYEPENWSDGDSEKCGGKKGNQAPTCITIVSANISSLRTQGKLPYIDVGINASGELKDEKLENGKVEIPKISFLFDGTFALIIGAVMMYILVLYCIDLGTRFAQMLFLQIIAPIPIIGFLSPKKDGIFQKWIKQCITTYLDLFLRIGIMYFVLLICQILGNAYSSGSLFEGMKNVSPTMKTFIYVALIMGLLVFTKKAPKMLEELFPKMGAASGNLGLKAGERVAPLAARAIGTGLGATRFLGGALARGINTAKRNKANGQKSLLTKEGREQLQQRHRNRGTYSQQRKERRKAQKALKGHDNDETLQQAFKTAKTKELEAKNRMAIDANKKYRGVMGNALAGGLGGAYRGAKSGFQATKLEEIGKKVQEGKKIDKEELASREKWLDSGGTVMLDRIAAKIEKEIGISSAPERTAARIKDIDDQIKGNEAMIKIESAGKGAVSKGEDIGKDKLSKGELSTKVDSGKSLQYKDAAGTKHTIETTGKTTLSEVYKDYAQKALTAKAAAEAAAKAKSDKEQEQLAERAKAIALGDTAKIAQLDADLKPISDLATAKAKDATDAEDAQVQVQKVLAREAYSQILDGIEAAKTDPARQPESHAEFDKGMVNEVRTALETVTVASSNSKTVEAMRSLIGNTDVDSSKISQAQFDAFIGNAPFTNYDDIDTVTKKLNEIASSRSRENQGYSEEKRKIESSDVYAAEKANAENSGGKK